MGTHPAPEPEPAEASSPPAAPGAHRVGDYVLVRQLGIGAMGIVYEAEQVSLKRKVALKMLHPNRPDIHTLAQRLRLEAEAAASLNHPHIVRIYEAGEHDGQPFFTMELVEGRELSHHLSPAGVVLPGAVLPPDARRNGPLAVAASVLLKIALAVHYAHQHGILHRDLKPGNIIIDQGGEPHLTDFGLAKLLDRDQPMKSETGSIVGTVAFMAPEQAAGQNRRISTAADIYSLGATLYAMLTGQPPFRAETLMEALRLVVDEEPRHPKTLNGNIDQELATICLKCLEKEPARRYASAHALASDLERWLRRQPIEARPVRTWGRLWRWCRREPKLAGMTAGLILLLAVSTGLAMTLYAGEKERRIRTELESAQRSKSLLARIEREGPVTNKLVLSAEDVSLFTRHDCHPDSTELRLNLASRVPSHLPHRVVPFYGNLTEYLQAALRQQQVLVLFDLLLYGSHDDLAADLPAANRHIVRADPVVYAFARQRQVPLSPVAQELYDGQPELRGAIITHVDSGIGSLQDLKQRSFAFDDAQSTLGAVVPRAVLVAAGVFARDLAQITNCSPDTVLSAVRTGQLDAGVVRWSDVELMLKAGVPLRVLSELRCPSALWVVTGDVPSDATAALQDAFLALRNPEILSGVDCQLTGLARPRLADYEALGDVIARARHFDRP
ncbi:MAG: protein kinase [Verrucomicrobia bacterium]|nr:protein kinase [Verrucomicrobiota bacterium]